MARTPESKVKEQVDSLLAHVGAYVLTPTTGGFGRSGHADKICCVPDKQGGQGSFLAVEVKAGKNKPTALQCRRLLSALNAGAYAAVVNETNLSVFQTWLDTIHNGTLDGPRYLLPKGITLSVNTKVGR
ncbi:hypothetical protein [Xenorhabdus innexi]|uniref:VRR-NUC domain-containing protein n=1 Tax=Xenorhabdus innexi TaxID=290109 RepID=A0A1N6MWW8_9GAMM|nr:hypothetical protein [Xenorhabdus innexi]PHM35967.1 hypothetical protein Xinn_02037 [Xenorhabdus innexi]SIP73267.1 hypothetical protein XIS1_1790073 [Xenorhabdus innexi]